MPPVDGFIARSNNDLDWLPPGEGEEHGYEAFIAVDALVIGRRSYDKILSRPLAPAPKGAVVERMAGTPEDIVAQLAARGVGHINVDGGITIQRFLRAGLIPAAYHYPDSRASG